MKPKSWYVILISLMIVAIMTVSVIVKLAVDNDKTRKAHYPGRENINKLSDLDLIKVIERSALDVSERFPYVAALARNASTPWEFACFASVILVKWIVTSAHCRKAGATHKVLLYHDYANNYTHSYPIMFWRPHDKFNASKPSPKYDIAVAKLNLMHTSAFTLKSATFDESKATDIEASVWKTVSTMDRRMFLTNDFERLPVRITHPLKCYESYGVYLDESMFCVDLSEYEDCFIHEFGPIFSKDKVVGILTLKPRDCDLKFAIFTNVSYYTNWILKSTRTMEFK